MNTAAIPALVPGLSFIAGFLRSLTAAGLVVGLWLGTVRAGDARALDQGERPAVRSAGLFVGISRFGPESGLNELRFAADDAVALAYLLVEELKLIPAEQAWIALGGEPTTPAGRRDWERLKTLPVNWLKPERKELRRALKQVSERASDPDGLLVMTFGTHGFMDGEKRGYLMPEDGEASAIADTGLSLATIEEFVRRARASKRLVIIDACRQPVVSDQRGDAQMGSAFEQALRAAQGFAVFSSCSSGESAWEDRDSGHGIYTRFILEGARGGVAGDAEGFIRLGAIADFAQRRTVEWVWENRHTAQHPFFAGDTEALKIPVAIDPQRKEAAVILRERRARAVEAVNAARASHKVVFSAEELGHVERRLGELNGEALERLLRRCERLSALSAGDEIENFLAWFRLNCARPAEPVVGRPLPGGAEIGTDPHPNLPNTRSGVPPRERSTVPRLTILLGKEGIRAWTPNLALQLRERVAQGLRDQRLYQIVSGDGFLPVRGGAPMAGDGYVLELTVYNYSNTIAEVTEKRGILKVPYRVLVPLTELSVGWKLVRGGVEIASEQVDARVTGRSLGSVVQGTNNKGVPTNAVKKSAVYNEGDAIEQAVAKIIEQIKAAQTVAGMTAD